MKPDLVLEYNSCALIIDAKFYENIMHVYNGFKTHWSDNLYQIFSYVKNMDANRNCADPHVSGMLLYAKTDESDDIDDSYTICGSSIVVKTLDLNVDFSEIQKQLDAIVREYFSISIISN